MYDDFDFYLIIDFEATCCDKGNILPHQMEIIEFGCVIVDAKTHEQVDEFESFVRAIRNPNLTDFCIELTYIRQIDVDMADTFPEVVKEFKKWLYKYNNFVFCSWGDFDRKQLIQDCIYHHVSNPVGSIHIDLKKEFRDKQLLRKKLGLTQALNYTGAQFEGIPHRGIDDARNMVKLIPYIFDKKVSN